MFVTKINFNFYVDIKIEDNSTIEVTYTSMGIEIIEPQYYKPGFPINFKVKFFKFFIFLISFYFILIIKYLNFRCY